MSYETDSASDTHDLLDRLRLFLVTDDWTVNKWTSDTQMYHTDTGLSNADSMRLHVSKTLGSSADPMTCYFNFRSATRIVLFGNHDTSSMTLPVNPSYAGEVQGIGINGSTGYSGTGNWDAEPGAPVAGTTSDSIGACIGNLPNGTMTYWLFSNGDTVSLVVEIANDVYMHMSFGRLAGKGSYTGGMFYAASCNSYDPNYWYWFNSNSAFKYNRTSFFARQTSATHYSCMGVYFTADGVADWRHEGYEGNVNAGYASYLWPSGIPPYTNPAGSYTWALGQDFITRAPNTINAVAPMMPLYVMSLLASGRYCYLGYPEGIRLVNRSLYAGGESLVLGGSGGDEWVIFPAHQIGPDTYLPDCTNLYNQIGFAYKKS